MRILVLEKEEATAEALLDILTREGHLADLNVPFDGHDKILADYYSTDGLDNLPADKLYVFSSFKNVRVDLKCARIIFKPYNIEDVLSCLTS